MSSKNWAAATAALFLISAAPDVPSAPGAAPLEAYGRLPSISDINLSPDGQTIAYVKTAGDKRAIVVQKIGVATPPAFLDLAGAKLRALQWADNTHLLITTSTTQQPIDVLSQRTEWLSAQTLDISTNTLYPLIAHNGAFRRDDPETMNIVTDEPRPRIVNGHTVVFVRGVAFVNHDGINALFAEDLTSGTGRMVSSTTDNHAVDWIIDDQGNVVAEWQYFEDEKQWRMLIHQKNGADTIINVAAPIDGPQIEGLSEDGSAIVYDLPQTEDWPSYQQISLINGNSAPWQRSDLHLGSLLNDPLTGRVFGGALAGDKSDYVFFDPHTQVVWNSIKAAFADATDVDVVSWSQDKNKVIARVFGPKYGDTYFFVDMTTHKADPIADEYDDIEDVSAVNWISYKAADGLTLKAYLTLPMNRAAKNLPLIVLPHGGPHVRDYPGFDWLSQALASRGYAVLQPQFRGSGGFGANLLSAGYGEFGKKMQTDLSDGVRALAVQGVIDPKRVCIVGASYGGYAALAGATLDSGVYRCAVSIAGLSDLKAMLRQMNWQGNSLNGPSDNRDVRFWDRFLGVSGADDPKLDAISPIAHVDRVSIPILLIHGTDDTVVPPSQSDEMADALKAAGKQVEYVKLQGEDHWLSHSDTRLQLHQATVKFLEANNPPN